MTRILPIIALLWVMPGAAFKASATEGSRGNLAEFPPIRTSLTITTPQRRTFCRDAASPED